MGEPRVTVIVPVYNGAAHLAETLASIAAQTRAPDELLVVDDGSTDDSAAIAEAAGATVIRRPNGGASAARNTGLDHATGDFVVFADADDVLVPRKLEAQLAWFAEHPHLGIVMARHELLVEPGAEHLVRNVRDPFFGDLGGIEPLGPSMIRREVVELVGEFDESAGHGDGLDWATRARRAGVEAAVHPDVLYQRRIHPGNASHQQAALQSDTVGVLRRRIAEQRGQ
jgi:glycosyltransferase involved in cell wall biosynthesis